MEKEPYFVYGKLQELETEVSQARRTKLRQMIALNVGSAETLRELFRLDSESLADFYNDLDAPHLTTDDTIDSFLEQFGRKSVLPPGDSLFHGEGVPGLDPLLGGSVAPADYMAELEAGSIGQPCADAEEAENTAPDASPAPEEAEQTPDNGSLTEGFAGILIKNGNYDRALEIISELYLKNPEKSIYFADQIRFIRKLMLNQRKKNFNNV